MRFILTNAQRLTNAASCTLGKILALGILLAVPTLGLTRLSSDLFASWQGRSDEETTLVGDSTEGLLAFDAPASTLREYQLRVQDSSASTSRGDGSKQPTLLAKDWRFTAQPANINQINGFMNTLTRDEFLSDLALLRFGVPSNIVNLVFLQQMNLNRIVNQDLLAIAQTTPLNVQQINGFVGNIVVRELLFDAWLTTMGATPNAMSFILGQQLGFNEVITQFFLLAAPQVPTPVQPVSPST